MASHYREWPVATARRVIECRWEQRIDPDGGGAGYVQRVLPDGCADVVIVDGAHAEVVGPTSEAALPELPVGSVVVGLRVRTEAISAVFGVPAVELRDRSIALDEVLGPKKAARLTDALLEGDDAWLCAWLSDARIDRRVAAAVGQLRAANGADVATVADVVGLSCRQLRRVLETETGLGPKTQQRIGRLHHFLALAEGAATGGLAQWAAMAGYADQAHLSKEVTALAATTPARLLAERHGGSAFVGTN